MSTETETTPAEKPAKAPKAAASPVAPVKAVVRINGDVLPGTMFVPKDADQRQELINLEAVEELSEAEQALFDKGVGAADILG